MRTLAALVTLVVLAARPATVEGQGRIAQSESARILAFLNEPREPEFGEIFDLMVRLRIAPGVVAFLSDTMVEAASSVSSGTGEWTVMPGPGDSVDVTAHYPVMAFLPGGVELPYVEMWTRPAQAGEAPGIRPSRELAVASRDAEGVEYALLYLGGIFVMPPSAMVGDDAGIQPRPPADVLGGERSAWLIAALLIGGLALASASWWLVAAARPGAPATPTLSARAEALRELDRIRALGWHTNGHVVEFYDATTGVLRRYAEGGRAEWRSALTSTELLQRLRTSRGAAAVASVTPAVWTAECVKFGDRRPAAEAAEADWSQVRAWIADQADGP